MRLQKHEIEAIKESFSAHFSSGHVYLFGSRVDDDDRGGDIDLFIKSEDNDNLHEKKIDFLVDVKQRIGDQKIDVVLSNNTNRYIEREALDNGVRLV